MSRRQKRKRKLARRNHALQAPQQDMLSEPSELSPEPELEYPRVSDEPPEIPYISPDPVEEKIMTPEEPHTWLGEDYTTETLIGEVPSCTSKSYCTFDTVGLEALNGY